MKVDNGIIRVLGPGPSIVVAVGQVLSFQVIRMPRVNGNKTRRSLLPLIAAKTARVAPVNYSTAGKNHHSICFGKRQGQRFPVHKIGADRMSPAHVSPFFAERVVLRKEGVLASVIDRAIGIIHPIPCRREVELRTIVLVIKSGRTVIALSILLNIALDSESKR